MPRVFSYLRFSADIQSRGDSIRRQAQLARDYCDKNGLVLDESLSFRDLGRSAFRNEHAATGKLGLFLKSIEEGKVKQGDILLIESIDRLSRSTITEELGHRPARHDRKVTAKQHPVEAREYTVNAIVILADELFHCPASL